MARRLLLTLLAAALAAVAAAPAHGASRLVVRGAGFGHGVGMSQYGALGQAQAGRTYQQILAHYYTGTALGRLDRGLEVRVLLQARYSVAFAGAARAGGLRLDPRATYSAAPGRGGIVVRSRSGRIVGSAAGTVRVVPRSRGVLRLAGAGAYRGALELRPGSGGVSAINAVGLDDYVRGVVARESPASWPAEALRAQAVAARTYAITTSKRGAGFDHYADTRSQVYGGVAAETKTTDAAVAATAGQVVTHRGKPVVTYFFSTSGGRTENVEFGFPGGAPAPHLKSVADPWDRVSPRHRWTKTFSLADATARLRGLVRGRLRAIRVVRRGVSPRVVRAELIGTGGRTTVDGPTLRWRLGLYDTWARFSVGGRTPKPPAEPAPQPAPAPGPGGAASGGTTAPSR